jgi:hypothetical protein
MTEIFCSAQISQLPSIKHLTKKGLPGHVSDGVAATAQEQERQVVLLHELDAFCVT